MGIVAVAHVVDLFDSQAEYHIVLAADQFVDLDIGAIQRSQCQSTVDHELHIAGAGSFLAGGADLFGYIRARCQDLGHRYVVVRQEDDFHHALYIRIVVDDFGNAVDQLDDALGEYIAAGSLGRKDIRMRIHRIVRIALDALIAVNDIHHIQQLALVGMQTLGLGIEDRIRIDSDTGRAVNIICQNILAFIFDAQEVSLCLGIIGIFQKTLEVFVVVMPGSADPCVHQFLQLRVAVKHPAARRDAVCLVVELLRNERVEIMEQIVFQDLGMQSRNTVDAVGSDNCQICHMDLIVADDAHALGHRNMAVSLS